jgi:hypothetical protein
MIPNNKGTYMNQSEKYKHTEQYMVHKRNGKGGREGEFTIFLIDKFSLTYPNLRKHGKEDYNKCKIHTIPH